MEFKKKESAGSFLKKGEEIKDGDILEILDEGKKVEGDYGLQNVFSAKGEKCEGNISVNQTSINNLIDAYGSDSKNWIGKKVKIIVIKQSVSGKIRNVYYFMHPNTELDEESGLFLLKGNFEKEEVSSETDKDDLPF